ncbi:MAG: cation diffusion facilitator family transporter [Vicingaceae bacterium]
MEKLIRIQRLTLFGSVAIMLAKAVAYFITSSNAIFSDVLESGVNVVAGGLALYSIILASKPKDENHPYGHGKIQFISASVEGALILVAGILIIGKAIYQLLFPQELSNIDLGIYLTGGAGLLNFIMAVILIRQGKQSQSMIMEADGKHLLSDALSTVGMIIGLTVVALTGLIWIDNLIALSFGVMISYTGINILKKSIPGIMDEADNNLLDEIILTLEESRNQAWIDLHNLRVIKYGNVLHLDCHVTLPWYYTNRQSHVELEKIEMLIREKYGTQAEMFIHTDPCSALSCSICQLSECKVREKEFEKSLEWNASNALKNSQHHL